MSCFLAKHNAASRWQRCPIGAIECGNKRHHDDLLVCVVVAYVVKGANLAQMAKLGLPVPPGFTITTDACQLYYTEKGEYGCVMCLII